MWTTRGLPIAPFLEQFIQVAKSEGYRYILLLVARPADEYALYESLQRDWKSINDLTGEEIMFLFVGPDAKKTNEMAGFLANESGEEKLFFSPYVAAVEKSRRSYGRRERLNNGYRIGVLAESVASEQEFRVIENSHEAQIKELRRRFSLKEVELPALVLIDLFKSKEQAVSVRGVNSLYPFLKLLVDEIESLEELKRTFKKLNSNKTIEKRISANYQRVLAVLSDADPSPHSPLADLQGILQEVHPWDAASKSKQLRACFAKIKADSSCEWFYRHYRGLIQALTDWLKGPVDTRCLDVSPRSDELADEISTTEETLLARAIGQHVSMTAPDEIASRHPDVVLVTVNEYETQAIHQAFFNATGTEGVPVPLEGRLYHNLGLINGTTVYHAISEMGSGGLGAMQQTVDKVIRALDPGAVIAVGIAFGASEKDQSLGDILLSKQIQLYELQRAGKTIVLRGDKPHAAPRLINHFEAFTHIRWQGAKVRPGLILSGEKLIDHKDYRDQLVAMQTEAVGGEMEGAGLYVASADHKVDWIVIKAICDWADGNKEVDKNQRQKTAAKNAADFLVESLKYAPLKRLDLRVPPSRRS